MIPQGAQTDTNRATETQTPNHHKPSKTRKTQQKRGSRTKSETPQTQPIAASDLPDDLVVITTVVATHMSSNIDIESSIETVTTPEVLGVKWDAEQITAVD